jgi:hypothetical protein
LLLAHRGYWMSVGLILNLLNKLYKKSYSVSPWWV